jgi:hypothetical protein
MLSYPLFFRRIEMRRGLILLIVILLVSICGISHAEADLALIKNAHPISRELNALFIKGMSRERIRSYSDALYAYDVILSKVQSLVNSRKVGNETVRYAIPYAIAAAYRKSIVTHRSIEGSVVKLYNQLKLYEDSEKWTNEVLTEISDVSLERGIEVSEGQYGMLYFARAYNKMGWAYALFNGNYWKRYLIYTPADTILMVDNSMDDLDRMYSIYQDNFKDKAIVSIGTPAEASVDFDEDAVSKYELLTYSLCYNTNDTSRLKILMGRQMSNSVKASLDLYKSKGVRNDLNTGRRIFTFEDMMDEKSRDVVVAMSKLLKEMGTN